MSATPPPPPPPSSSSSPTGQPYGRPSAGPYRGAGQQQHVRTSPQQRPPTTQSSPTFNRFFTRGAGASAPSSSPSGGGSGGAPANAAAAFGSLRGSPGNAGTRSHVDPSARGIGPTCTPPATSTTTSEPLPPTTGAPVPPAVSAELLQSLTLAVHESLSAYLYPDAVELAQRLFNLDGSFSNLHLLAHAHLLSGSTGTAYRLLHHHFPFFELHVTRPRTASATHGGSSAVLGSSSVSGGGGGGGGNADGGVGGTQLPLDARRTWSTTTTTTTTAGRSATSSTFNITGVEHSINFSYERVDLKAQWDCQYLLGVCCYRTQHYEDGVKVLSQLLYVKQQLDGAVASLRRQQQQQQASTNAASSEGADWKASVERQLRAYTFVTDAKQSQLLYWLGLCEKQRQRQAIAADYLRKSFTLYSTRLDAFQEYVRLGWPSEEVVQDLLTVKEPLAEEEDEEDEEEEKAREREGDSSRGVEMSYNHQQQQQQQRPPLRRARESTTHAATAAASAERLEDEEQHHHRARHNLARPRNPAGEKAVSLHGPSLTLAQRRCLERHLQPFLRAVFLTTTYRCPEAVEAVRSVLLQQPTSSVPATPAGPPAASAESPWLLRQLALAQFHNGDVAESAETFERLLRAAPWDLTSTALIFYSTALWHLKSESALGSLAQRLTDAEPYSPTTFCVVANAYSLIKDPRDALVMLKRAVQVAPTLAYAHALYGYELLGQDNRAEAENAFKTALAVDHTLYIAYAGLGERFIREEQVGKARDYYKEAVKINPTPAIMNRFALTYHRQEKSETHLKCALRLYTESLQRHPNNTTARRQRTDVLLRLDRPKEALEELKALLVQCPGEAAVYMTLAECMVCLRRPQEALQHYQTAMHLDPRRESYVQGCIDRLVAARML